MNANEPTPAPADAIEERDPAEQPRPMPGWGLGDNPPPGFLRPASSAEGPHAAVEDNPRTASIYYRNHRGEVRWRRVVPRGIHFGSSAWHPEQQWLLEAFDLDKLAYRTFAVAGIKTWLQRAVPSPSDAEAQAAAAESRRCWDEAELAAQTDKPAPCPMETAAAELRRLWDEGKLGPRAKDKARCSQAIPSTESPSQTIFEDVGGFVAHSVNGEAFLVFADGAVKLSSVSYLKRHSCRDESGDHIHVILGEHREARFEPWPRKEAPAPSPDPSSARRAWDEGELAPAPQPPTMLDNRGNEIAIGDYVQITAGGRVMRIAGAQVDDRNQVLALIRNDLGDGTAQWVWVSPKALVKSNPDAPALPLKPVGQ